MAIYQGGSGNSTIYYSVPDDAAWTFPDSDWFLYFWTRVEDNTGSTFQYIFSNNNFQVANSLNIYLREASASSPPDAWQVAVPSQTIQSSSAPGADGVDRLVCLQRSSGNIQMYFCEAQQTATSQFDVSYSDGALNGGTVNIGRRVDGQNVRYWDQSYGDVVKGSVALTIAQLTLLGKGVDPVTVIGAGNLDLWFPFREADATVRDIIGGLDATRQGSPTTVEHFPFVSSSNVFVGVIAVAPTGRIMSSLANGGGLAGRGGIAGAGGGLAG